MIGTFFHSECDEAPLRRALGAAAPDYQKAEETQTGRRRSPRIVSAFVASAAPRASPRQRKFAAQLVFTTVTAIGQQVSERRPARAEVDRWADAVSDMLLTYCAQLRPSRGP